MKEIEDYFVENISPEQLLPAGVCMICKCYYLKSDCVENIREDNKGQHG